jgi:hypothetical protein
MNPCEEMRQFYIAMFHEKGESVLPVLCSLTIPQNLFMEKYKSLPPIEKLEPEEKTKMKKYVHELFPDKDVAFKLQAAKIIYTIGTLL